ncbi:MAG: hypothetical protein ACE5J3_13635 [Methanosarcinales archaeon]
MDLDLEWVARVQVPVFMQMSSLLHIAEGVKLHIEFLKQDLFRGMIMTGCSTIKDIDSKILC